MISKYIAGNRYEHLLSLSDAAIGWEGLSLQQQEAVMVGDDGLPFILSHPDLHDRAEGLLIAVRHGLIKGSVHNEDGVYFHARNMKLDRASVASWIASTEKRLIEDTDVSAIQPNTKATINLEKLLTKEELLSSPVSPDRYCLENFL